MRLDKREADEAVGGARQRLNSLDDFARQQEKRLAERTALAADLGLYEDLRTAFGKRGVPATPIARNPTSTSSSV